MKVTHPQAFLIAQTDVDKDAMDRALGHIGVTGWTTDAEVGADRLTEFAGKSCYMSFDMSQNNNLTRTGFRNNRDYIQDSIIGNGHGSVLEHSTATFFITNVSRVVTHEIVRHRAGTAFSQMSGRYVRSDDIHVYVPQDIIAADLTVEFHDAVKDSERRIAEMVEKSDIDSKNFEEKKRLTSALRRVAGVGAANHIVVTANHRAWRHMIELRTHPSAEEEIRVVFTDIARQLRENFPTIYADMSAADETTDPARMNPNIRHFTFRNSKV